MSVSIRVGAKINSIAGLKKAFSGLSSERISM